MKILDKRWFKHKKRLRELREKLPPTMQDMQRTITAGKKCT